MHLAGAPQLPPMVLGPSLGVPVTALWSSTADRLGRSHHVIGWDLPGHGASPPLTTSCTIGELADAVAALADTEIGDRPFVYAGVSVGGAVGLQVLLDHPGRISAAALICTGAKIGTPEDWIARAGSVRRDGMGAMVPGRHSGGSLRDSPNAIRRFTACCWSRCEASTATVMPSFARLSPNSMFENASARSTRPSSRWPARTTS